MACVAVVTGSILLAGAARVERLGRGRASLRVAAVDPVGQRLDPTRLVEMLDAARTGRADGSTRRYLAIAQQTMLAATERELRNGAAVVVWPEAGAPVLAADEPSLIARAGRLTRELGGHVLLGIATIHEGAAARIDNQAILVGPDGTVAMRYRKTRLVPGWEARNVVAGDGRIEVRPSSSGRLAAAICFDLDFPALLRQAGRERADLLLAPSSDWPAIGRLHHAMATFRAVENGVSLVRAARWGVSSVVDPAGRTLSITDHGAPGADAAVAFAPSRGVTTVYARIGDVVAWACGLVTILALGAAATVIMGLG